MAQGILPYQYEKDKSVAKMTALGGLPAYMDLASASGLIDSIRKHCDVRGDGQGWTDEQINMSLIMLNLAGGDCVEDLRILEGDEGFAEVLMHVETHGLPRKERRALKRRWRKDRHRAVPSPSPVFRYLKEFHDAEEETKREKGKAFIPEPTGHLKALGRVNKDLVAFAQQKSPEKTATLDMDATLVETCKQESLFCYKGFKAYQPLNTYWFEQGMLLHSEFRDGNVPAGWQQLRVFKEALACLPAGVEKVYLRSDTAAYQHDLLRYCAEGQDERFGKIEFAIGVDVTPSFKESVLEVDEKQWHTLYREEDGERVDTGQEYAEVCFVPDCIARKKDGPEYHYLAVREKLPDEEQKTSKELPFPTQEFGGQKYKLFGTVTNLTESGGHVINWQRERCGKGEEVHGIIKDDLAGGQLPSKYFGANAAWWAIALLALNLNALMKLLILPDSWIGKRLKAIRFGIINVAGRVMEQGRQLGIRISGDHPSIQLLIEMRQRILCLAQPP